MRIKFHKNAEYCLIDNVYSTTSTKGNHDNVYTEEEKKSQQI